MHSKKALGGRARVFRPVISVLACLALLGLFRVGALSAEAQAHSADPVNDSLAHALDVSALRPIVVQSSRNDISPALRGLRAQPAAQAPAGELPNFILPKALSAGGADRQGAAPAIAWPGEPQAADSMPSPLASFDGVPNMFGGWPPDTQGDIGPQHYVQWVNLHFAIWEIDRTDQSAALVYGPAAGSTLFQGFGGVCENNNDGDPITLYDPFANRWFMSQFALPNWPNGPFYQCVAVSQSGDPTSGWYRYEFQSPVNKMNDYPKFGVWPDAYYMTINQFNAGSMSSAGAGVAALERQAMLQGQPARMVYFDLYTVNTNYGGILPADFDGLTAPQAGAPGYFVEWDDSAWFPPQDALRLWEFHVDWSDTGNSTFGLSGAPNQVIPTADVDPNLCNFSRNCIPQPGTSTKLDAISDRLMHRLQYRNFGSYQTLVSNHTIDVDGSDHAGVHWLELRQEQGGGGWSLYQQGVYAPDSAQRWMGSIAMDHSGNLALGYSVAGASIYPSVRYTGRLAGDPLGSMPQGEQSLVEGGGSQTGSNRWGDYSMMGVDPLDDCTFWYTQEYVAVSGSNSWKTRIGAFRFPTCSSGPSGALEGTVSDSGSGVGIEGALVSASLSPTQTYSTIAGEGGAYGIRLPVGVYSVSASAFGYLPAFDSGVVVFSGTVTNYDFVLQPAPTSVISGTVRDANTGWPLYARIEVDEVEGALGTVWSDPVSGYYSLTLPQGLSYHLAAEAFTQGYLEGETQVHLQGDDMTQDIELQVDAARCQAPGYRIDYSPDVYASDFEVDDGGLAVSGKSSWAWGVPTTGPGTAASGQRVWATNLDDNYLDYEAGYLSLPPLDLSGEAVRLPVVRWQQWLQSEAGYDFASLEASKDGGATWQEVYGPLFGNVDLEWRERAAILDAAYAVSDLRLRFRFISDYTVAFPGWYLDDLSVAAGACRPSAGGLVVGNVYDANSGQGLNEAEITTEGGWGAVSQATEADPGLADGFYTLFSEGGSQTLTAAMAGGYQALAANVSVVVSDTIRQDFYLPAGQLTHAPAALEAALQLGDSLAMELNVANQGGAPASFELIEMRVSGGSLPLGPYDSPEYVVKVFKQDIGSSERLGLPGAPPARARPSDGDAGQVIRSWEVGGAASLWAAAYDGNDDAVWVSSPSPVWNGDDHIYQFTPEGLASGLSYLHTAPHISGPADLAYNWNTSMLWIMNVNTGVANCIYEIDPQSGYTGQSICPESASGFANSQRGLAYDPQTDTWFAGGWNDLMIYRFDSQGNILSSVNTGLAISGLAYNPDTQHLFVMVNDSPNLVYVLDVADDYKAIGQFSPSEGFGDYSGAGLEIDCQGDLWAVDQKLARVYLFASGESASLCRYDLPWLSLEPVTATVGALAQQSVTATFDASLQVIDQPGVYRGRVRIAEDTPYPSASLPATMTVSPPPAWGKLQGVVSSLGHCDSQPEFLHNAAITIESPEGLTWTVQSDGVGYYQRWLPSSVYTLSVVAAEHAPVLLGGVAVAEGGLVVQDFGLHWLRPCVRAAPQAFEVTLKQGRSVTLPLRLENSGYAASTFELLEIPLSPAGLPSSRQVEESSEYTLLDEGFEAGLMPPSSWQRLSAAARTWEIASAVPHSGSYYARVLYDYNQDEWLISPELYLAEGMLSFWSYGSLYWCRDVHDNCDLNVWIVVGDPGGGDDIYVGKADDDWMSGWAWSQSQFDLAPFLHGGPARIGFQYQGSDGAEIALDDIFLEGIEGGDVPWLAVTPLTGSLPISGVQVISLTFTAAGDGAEPLYQPGDYHALLELMSEDPLSGSLSIPLTMTVIALDYGVDLSADRSLHDIPSETVLYTLTLTNTSEGPLDSFTLSLGAHDWPTTLSQYTIGPLAQGESALFEAQVQIPETASGGDSEAVIVTAASQGDPSKTDSATLTTLADTPSADLQVYKSISAGSASQPIQAGETATYTLVVVNHGPTKAIRVTLLDVLPDSVHYLSDDGGCSLAGQVLACQWAKFLVGESRTVHVLVRPMQPGMIINQALVVADTPDPDPANNWVILYTSSEGYVIYLPLIGKGAIISDDD
ncbi:MAG: carboxypeptidase regulatory-like domain-containing protein [Anaerolineales bacterium]|nr:carboxypeptidase regulatory-like domain-containing protein [Anaerolineales bacterium]